MPTSALALAPLAPPAPLAPTVGFVPRPQPGYRLHVAVVTETYPPEINGVATTAARFVDGLRGLGHQVSIVRPRQPDDDVSNSDELLVRALAIPRYPDLRMGLSTCGALRRLWVEQRPDVVHIVTEGPLGVVALWAARSLQVPVASDFRTNFDAYSRHYRLGFAEPAIRGYLRAFHNRTQATMVPTGAMQTALASSGFTNLHVVSRGVDARRFDPARRSDALRQAWGAGASSPVVLSVGRLAAEKNLLRVCEAYDAIRQVRPDARLVFVGDGPLAGELRARCPKAIFAGVQRGEDLAVHYASADVFAFPSLSETYGNVVPEAMASGLAVSAFNDAAAGEHILHGVNGMIACADDPQGFVRNAVRLATDRLLRQACGRQARRTSERLTWEHVIRAQLAVLRSVAKNRVRDQPSTNARMGPAI